MRYSLLSGAVCIAVLSGCEGGGSETVSSAPPDPQPTPSEYPILNPEAAVRYKSNAEFTAVGLSLLEENTVRQQLGVAPACANYVAANCTNSSPYVLQNIHFAHTATLADGKSVRGDGQLIAVVDDGFRISHQEFANKQIRTYLGSAPSLQVEQHGTSVAAIAAANTDGRGIMGVAPNSALHLTSFGNVSSSNLLSHLTGATLDASANGAKVQNNSWGWASKVAASDEQAAYQASGASTYANYLPSRLGGSSGQWADLFASYRTFQQNGVVVFANANEESLGDVDAWAALPLFVPELQGAWIVAANALFSVDRDSGKILDSDLISAPCGSAASFCLTANGTVHAPTASSDTSYGTMTGTSFAAPQISGQIALLAQAFPQLAPQELTTRLLATAQNDWSAFQQSVSGSVQFGANVSRPISSLYGLGVPDMAAALAPVGGLAVATGHHVATSPRHSVGGGLQGTAPVVGTSLKRALAGRDVMLLDQLGGDFYVKGEELTTTAQASHFQANPSEALASSMEALSFGFSQVDSEMRVLEDTATAKLFFSQAHQNVDGATRFSSLMPISENQFFQYSGQMEKNPQGDAISFSMSRLTNHEALSVEFTLSGGHATNSFFGSVANGPFVSALGSSNVASAIGLTFPSVGGWSVTGFAEVGVGDVDTRDGNLITYDPFMHGSIGFSASRRQLLNNDDRITLYGGVLPTAIAGSATARVPTSRSQDGLITFEQVRFDLRETDMPMRAGLSYTTKAFSDFDLTTNLNSDFWAGGAHNTSFSVGLKKQF